MNLLSSCLSIKISLLALIFIWLLKVDISSTLLNKGCTFSSWREFGDWSSQRRWQYNWMGWEQRLNHLKSVPQTVFLLLVLFYYSTQRILINYLINCRFINLNFPQITHRTSNARLIISSTQYFSYAWYPQTGLISYWLQQFIFSHSYLPLP